MKRSNLVINKNIDKNEIKSLINWYIVNYGSLRSQKLTDKLKILGLKYSTDTGISLNIRDLKIPPTKREIFINTKKNIREINLTYEQGIINFSKKTEKINQLWNNTNELVKNEIILHYRQTNLLNPLYMMILSGARGNIAQIKQLIGMRGLMSDSQGEIINLPITSNFKEGLSTIEYFISCYGARKGLVDTALKTANSGYLTRRLIYTSQNQIINHQDCQTKFKKLIGIKKNNKKNYQLSKENIIGNVIAKEIVDKTTNKIIIDKGQDICNVRFE